MYLQSFPYFISVATFVLRFFLKTQTLIDFANTQFFFNKLQNVVYDQIISRQ